MNRADALLLAFDVGNTTISVGLFRGDALALTFRLKTDPARTADEYASLLMPLLATEHIVLTQVKNAAISSVVPSVTQTLRAFCLRYLPSEPLVVTGETPTGLTLRYEVPATLGADRLINAFAAHAQFSDDNRFSCIVVDWGTATKIEAITHEGIYLGGAILPGVGISRDSLFDRAALLRQIEMTAPTKAIGTNTADALRSGILLGYAAQADGLVARFKTEMPNTTAVRVIGTGGFASLIAPYTETVQTVDEHLILTGLHLLWRQTARE